ncbi:MAG TPA: transcriptional regulator [Ruminococcaceae bacterium]|jgi:DNA-binding FrmR family transcriptional regulator|nr:transcriptional regulator [Oscillospiraceae bacterium]HBQ46060.1 transcriptional regulator [Oscillospiraceae bacterium]HBT91182.1 transcriptional regulator [Oscillospiraceae bacterium]HCB92188.1 transcriptional regulator [Oscillospiraceae bacterium]
MMADQGKIMRMLKTARGQLDGLIKMVEDDRYCIDISNQLMATQAILRNINREVLHAHLNCCVEEAFEKGNRDEARQKIKEIMEVMDKLAK